MTIYQTSSAEETIELGQAIGAELSFAATICFFGPLAAGKTTFIRGLVEGATQSTATLVHSPTYTYLNIYPGRLPVYHFDLYRLKNEEDFIALGFDEFLQSEGICCVEWAERIPLLLPQGAIQITIDLHTSAVDNRRIAISPWPLKSVSSAGGCQ